jgi:hypothetical protein
VPRNNGPAFFRDVLDFGFAPTSGHLEAMGEAVTLSNTSQFEERDEKYNRSHPRARVELRRT